MEFRGIYKCIECGNTVEAVDAYEPPILCCGEEMVNLEEQTEDSSIEKHVPVVEETDEGLKVTVGSTIHPMTEKHFIVFIEVITNDDLVLRQDLSPDDEPIAEFPVPRADVKKVREYCNVHDLWKA